jgi:K+-sensing histidine kinase KdpD
MRNTDKAKERLISELAEIRQRLAEIEVSKAKHARVKGKAREVETSKELDKLRTELIADISHAIRTSLANIKGFATMLLDYDKRLKRDEKREYLETIDKNADQLVELMEQLLEISRLDGGEK